MAYGSSVAALAGGRAAFGMALGLFELAAPRRVAKADGVGADAAHFARIAGIHKFVVALGMAAARDKRPWMAAALAGAAFDAWTLSRLRGRPRAFAQVGTLAAADIALALMVSRWRRRLTRPHR